MDFNMKHIISINDFQREEIDYILDQSKKMEELPQKDKIELFKGKVMASLFFEPSTRTKDSFISACLKMGGNHVGFSDTSSTSLKKGETFADTIRMYEKYSDILVIRHSIEGAARYASEILSIPVINGGDGANQHPTQTLLDLYSIKKSKGSIDNNNILIAGDLKYGRTVHSLSLALSLFDNINLTFVSPPSLRMPDEITEMLRNRGVSFSIYDNLEEAVRDNDIIYMTRIQRERFPNGAEYERVKNSYLIDRELLERCPTDIRIMHPLPRVGEISTEVDHMPQALYFQQAANGIPVRQSLLMLLTGGVL